MSYVRKGGQVATRPRGKQDRFQNDVRDTTKSGTLSRQAMWEAKREAALEARGKPMTREEFDAARRKEEAEERERLSQLRKEHEEHERNNRAREADERRKALQRNQ